MKPKLKIKTYLDYHECRDYLEAKYGYNERDYAGLFAADCDPAQPEPPYWDFWHWVCDTFGPSNGGTIEFSNETLECCEEDWQKTILGHYLNEFGLGPNRECSFVTEW